MTELDRGIVVGTESTLYQVVLILHILVAIVGIGTVMLNGLYGAESKKRPGPGGLAIAQANYRVSMVAENFIYAILVLGIILVWLSDGQWAFSQTWVWLSIVAFVVSLGVSHGVLLPRVRQMNALVEELAAGGPPPAGAPAGPPPQVAMMEALGKQVGAASGVLHLMTVVLLYLMVFKPGA
ncbi:MAG: hypothetical protein ACKO72_04925 [Actinomycetes bacterium]